MSRLHAPALAILLSAVFNPTQAQQPRSTFSEHLDSAEIRNLPLSVSTEISSFLPGSIIGLSYDSRLPGSLGQTNVRVDDVPAPALHLSSFALSSVDALLYGTSPRIPEPTALLYSTRQSFQRPAFYARGASDNGLPGSVGMARIEGGARLPLGKFLRISADATAQSALQTEFNNYSGVPVYRMSGIASTITYGSSSPSGLDVVKVPVPAFERSDDGDVPTSNWNALLANARIDVALSEKSDVFVAGYFSRLQQRSPFGNAGCSNGCELYNLAGQRAQRDLSSLITFGLDQQFGTTLVHARIARSSSETTAGVLTPQSAADAEEGYGLDVSPLEFLIDNDKFPVNDRLITSLHTNETYWLTPFGTDRTDANPSAQYRTNPYGVLSTFATRGFAGTSRYDYSSDSHSYASLSLQQDVGVHRLQLGGNVTSYDVKAVNVYYNSATDENAWQEKPSILSAWAQDAITTKSFVAQAGVRLDAYDSHATFPVEAGVVAPPATFAKAPRRTAVSPRVAVAVPLNRFTFRAGYGRYMRLASFSYQFDGMNTDFFNYHNTTGAMIFSDGALKPITLTSATIGEDYAASARVEVSVNLFSNEAKDLPEVSRLAFEAPFGQGVDYLNVRRNGLKQTEQGGTLTASYSVAAGIVARGGITHFRTQRSGSSLVFPSAASKTSTTTLTLLLQDRAGRLGGVMPTVTVRAASPETYSTSACIIGAPTAACGQKSAWLIRADAHIVKAITLGAMHGQLFLDALRFAGSGEYLPNFIDEGTIATGVEIARENVGGGQVRGNIDLTTLHNAQPGVRNEVDLYMLQQAEQRFGNGDQQFSAEEQIAAFGAAEKLKTLAGTPLSQSRRLQLGVSISF